MKSLRTSGGIARGRLFGGSFLCVLLFLSIELLSPSATIMAEPTSDVSNSGSGQRKTRVMVVLPEFHIEREVPDPAAETEIIKCLLSNNYQLVDQKISGQVRYSDQMKAIIGGDTKAAQELGLRNSADIIIYGEAFSERAQDAFGVISCRARVEVRAVKCSTGEIVAADAEFASAADMAELIAGKKALEKAGKRVCEKILEQMTQAAAPQEAFSSYQIYLTNIDYERLRKIEKALGHEKGVRSIVKDSFDGSTALLTIECSMELTDVADVISDYEFDDFDLKVTGLNANRLEVRSSSNEQR